MNPARQRDPFAPVETVSRLLLSMIIIAVIVGGAAVVVQALRDGDSTMSIATIGDEQACATVTAEALPAASDIRTRGLRDMEASAVGRTIEVCLWHPSFAQKAASTLTPLGDLAFALGGLFLLRRTITTGRRVGLFRPELVRSVDQLGWFLLAMTLFWPFVAAAGRGVVLDAAVVRASWWEPLWTPDLSVALVIVSLGVLTVARILGRAVALQADVDATI